MQTVTICAQCQAEDGTLNAALALARIPEEGVIESTCSRGHRSFTVIQQMKFELLSDMAILAIVDGYYRDAIASFIGALERLHEFFVEAMCRKRDIARDVFTAAWKPMGNRSERQLGAFIAAYVLETGEPPKLLPDVQTKLRNDVIHKGKFPERNEVVRFGQAVLACALPILALLKSPSYSIVVAALVREQMYERSKVAWDADLRPATSYIGTFLSLANTEQQTDIEAVVASYASRSEMTRGGQESRALGAIIEAVRNASSQPCHDDQRGEPAMDIQPPVNA